MRHIWVQLGSNTMCDAGAGEKYMPKTSQSASSIEACEKFCQDDSECKSITFYNSGWCSHFSTECTNTKYSWKAISKRRSSPTTTPASPCIMKILRTHAHYISELCWHGRYSNVCCIPNIILFASRRPVQVFEGIQSRMWIRWQDLQQPMPCPLRESFWVYNRHVQRYFLPFGIDSNLRTFKCNI